MNYPAAITDFFKSPKWVMNLLLAGLCCIIPIVGVMVVTGWLITGFWCREDERFETFPDFDFKFFGRNLERGVWPVLAFLILMIVIVPIIWIASIVVILILGGMSHHGSSFVSIVVFFLVSILSSLVLAFASLFYTPFYLRAARLQDFAAAFKFDYAKKFISSVSQEILMAALTMFVSMVGMSVLSMIPCVSCLALILYPFVIAFWVFVYFHLINQLYKLFLTRGGEAIPLSPKLTAEPPAPPTAPPSGPFAPQAPPPVAPPPSTPLPPAPPPGGPPIP